MSATSPRQRHTHWASSPFSAGLHSLLDGVVYSISFSVSTFTGALVALGMVLHEFPEGIVTYALLVRSAFSAGRSFLLALTLPPLRPRLLS